MDLNAAYLILQPLPGWRTAATANAHPQRSTDTEVFTYSRSGNVLAVSLYTSTPVQSPTLALADVATAICRWPLTPAAGSLSIVPLHRFNPPAYLHHKRSEINVWRRALIREVFQCSDEYIDRYFFSLLYLEPREPLLTTTAPTRSELEAAVRRIRILLHDTGSAAVPQRYRDLFVCPGTAGLSTAWDLVAIRQSPLEEPGRERHVLPESIFRLTTAVTLIHRLEAGKKAVDSHPLLSEEPSAYVSKLLEVSPEHLPRLRWLKDTKAAIAYAHHMAARLQGIGSKDSARSLASEFRSVAAQFATNAAIVDDDWLWYSDTFTENPYRYGLVSSLRSDLQEAGETMAQAADELALRDQAISDYFTDYLNAAVARSNMLLQRRVLWLTIVAVLLAVLSLVQSWPVA